MPRIAIVALGLTVLTVILAFVYAGPQPDCGGATDQPDAPGWTGTVAVLAMISGLAAVVSGLAALGKRRWVVAAVSVVVNPLTLLAMIASSCAFY
jgi:hypothetical protein